MKMNNKYICIILIFLLCLISISSASAAEDTVNADDNQELILEENMKSDISTANNHDNTILEDSTELNDDENKKTYLKAGETTTGTFSELNEIINGNTDNYITLEGNYTYDDSSDASLKKGIKISRAVTIDGQGCTLNGNNLSRIFYINDINGIVIKNINFINGNAGEDRQGGAIYLGDITKNYRVINCNFTNNTAIYGGAMCLGTAINCTFTENKAIGDPTSCGGAMTYGTAINCTFNLNSATGAIAEGGATYTVEAYDCNFTLNHVDGGKNLDGDIEDSGVGGAMYDGVANNCNFVANPAPFNDDNGNTFATECIGCTFHTASLDGSTFYTTPNSGEIMPVRFLLDNGTSIDGLSITIKVSYNNGSHDIYNVLSGEGLPINLSEGSYCSFLTLFSYGVEKNIIVSENPKGSFTYLNQLINIDYPTNDTIYLDKNYTYDPIIDYPLINGIILKRPLTINGNGFTIDGNDEAQIFNIISDNVSLNDIEFSHGKENGIDEGFYGGSIFWYGNNGHLSDCTFQDNNASKGAAIYWVSPQNDKLTIDGCTFIRNNGESIIHSYAFQSPELIIHNSIFLNNNVDSIMPYEKYDPNLEDIKIDADYNWFGHNATNYSNKPIDDENIICKNWLFLNGTANPNKIPFINSSEIVFKLYLYNETDGVSYYDNTLLPRINLTLSAIKGDLYYDNSSFGDPITFKPTDIGTASITASIEDAQCTIGLESTKADVELDMAFDQSEIDYGENATIKLEFYPNAKGTVNITFTGNKRNYTFNDISLNNTILIPGLLPDEYQVNLTYSGEHYFLPSNASAEDKLIVNKINPNMTVEGYKIYVNDTEGIMFTVSLVEDATGNINLNGDIKKQINLNEGKIKDGKLVIEIENKGLGIGKYNVRFDYSSNDIYKNSTLTSISEIMIIETEIIAKNKTIDLLVGEKATVNYTKNPSDMVGDISFSSNATNVVKVNPSTGEIEAIREGMARVTISFSGSENYTSSNATVDIKVNKESTQLTAVNITSVYNTENYLKVILKDSKNKPISGAELTVQLNGEKKYTTDNNGTIKIPTKDLTANTYIVNISFAENNKYKKTNTTAKITIEKDSTQLKASNITATYKEDKYLEVSLKDSKNKPISGAELTVQLNGEKKYTTDNNGTIKIPTKDLTANTYIATINYAGSENYLKSNCSAEVNVERKTTKFNFSNMTTTAINYIIDGRNGKYFNFYLFDADGKPLEGKNVSIGFNEKVYNKTTDANGRARLQINLAKVFKYTFALAFLGDENYNGTFDTASITVMPQTPKLSTSSKTYKSTAKTKSLSATFKTSRGNPVANRKIKFTVNGKTYTGKTNSKGIATVKVSLNKKGTYKFTVKFAGDNTYKAVSKSAKLTIK